MSITAEMLLKNKQIIKERTAEKQLKIKVKGLEEILEDPTATIKSLDINTITRISQQANGDVVLSNILTVYNGMVEPNLKDKNLQKGYEVKAHEIVTEILDLDEVQHIAAKISKLSGFTNSKEADIIEEIKNE